MYISYDNLWKLLIDKGMTKRELMELTGMSSRTLAKLSKNQNVNTQTLISICQALGCSIEDVIKLCPEEEPLSFYQSFKRNARLISKEKYCRVYELDYKSIKYTVLKTVCTSNKHTIIRCEEQGIVWEQLYPVGISQAKEITVIAKRSFPQEGTQGIFIISGSPLYIKGLDENGYVSTKGMVKKPTDVYVMTNASFKLFEPK